MIDQYITGSSGFIGQHLFSKLYERGDRLDCIHHGQMVYDDCENLFFLSTYGNMVSHTEIDKIIKANVEDVIWWLRSDLVKGLFIFMSSSSVNLPVQTPYSRTKRAGEEMVQSMAIPSCIVRPFSVTGVGEQPEHLIPTLIRSCFEGTEMEFDPKPVHDFIDVEDVVNGLVELADSKSTGIFEFGSGIPTTNEEVAYLVQRVTGKEANLKIVDSLRSYDNTAWFCHKPAWKSKKDLVHSIREMVDAYETQRS